MDAQLAASQSAGCLDDCQEKVPERKDELNTDSDNHVINRQLDARGTPRLGMSMSNAITETKSSFLKSQTLLLLPPLHACSGSTFNAVLQFHSFFPFVLLIL
jgi:hypothetical protein